MQVKKQHLEADMEQWTGSKLGKEYVKAVYCHPVNLTYIWSTSCEMGRMNHKLESRFLGEISTTSDTKPLILRSPLMRVKEESKKAVLKLKIQNTKMMASSPIASWQIDGEKVETVTDFIFLDSKITVDGDCRHEIKRCLLLRRKAVTNSFRPCIKKQRYHFADRSPYSQSSGFSSSHVRRRSDVFEMWCWTGLESPLDSKDLKPVNPKGNQY